MGRNFKSIDVYDTREVQTGLFTNSEGFAKWFPTIYRDITNFKRILYASSEYLGLDFEFPSTFRATIIGIANLTECAAVAATPELILEVVEYCKQNNIKLVGHAVLGAEKPCIEKAGGNVCVTDFEDSMLKHYLLNADLAKAPDKSEADDAGALGFMGLWTAVSMCVDVPCWKEHRGEDCEGIICPSCDVKGYCAVDAWASLVASYQQDNELIEWDVPLKLYEELLELTYIAQQMQDQGIKVNMQFVNDFNTKSEEYKDKLFEGKNWFNPRSPVQVQEWFKGRGIPLEGTDKKKILKVLHKVAAKYGFVIEVEGKLDLSVLAEAESLPEELDAAYRLYEFKSSGKGLDPWFGDKYRDSNDYIHPRFITIGASTSRWSSSKPNFTNIPTRGFGALVGAAIIPRSDELDLVSADASNLELRDCLYLAGVDPTELFKDKDPFMWLVEESQGKFDKAAEMMGDTPRQAAKSVAHASSYLEGIKIIPTRELGTANIKKQEAAGVLRIYRDWHYRGGVVAFTGANLAERLFGSKSYENRRKALAISEDIYFRALPYLRKWHREVLSFIEENGFVRYPTGHFLRLYGDAEEDAKMGCAALGQGVGAHHMQGLLLRFYREKQRIPLLFIHDSFTFEIPTVWNNKQAYEFISLMGEETDRLPGFRVPFKAKRGRCFLEYNEKNSATHIVGAMKPLKYEN